MKYFLLLISLIVLTGCAHKIAVATLESTIQEAALAVKRAAGDASEKVTIEVAVTNGYKGSATAPIPVVPIGAEASLMRTTKLTLDVKLKNYTAPAGFVPAPTNYTLDLKTGALEEAKSQQHCVDLSKNCSPCLAAQPLVEPKRFQQA